MRILTWIVSIKSVQVFSMHVNSFRCNRIQAGCDIFQFFMHCFNIRRLVFMVASIILITSVSICSAFSLRLPKLAINQNSKESGLPVEISNYIQKLPEDKQHKILQSYLKHGIYVNLPMFWSMVTEPSDVFRAIDEFGEPLSRPMLDALERILPGLKDHSSDRIRASALLYRYGRQSGDLYLTKELSETADIDAATIYALNHDAKHLSEISAALLKYPDSNLPLIYALGSWSEAPTATILLQAFKMQPDNANFALALGEQNSKEALPLLRKLYFTSGPDEISKVYAAAAIVKLAGNKAIKIRQVLFSQLTIQSAGGTSKKAIKRHYSDLTLQAIIALGQVKEPSAVVPLREIIKNYLKAVPNNKATLLYSLVPQPELAVNAAEALAKLNDASSRMLLNDLLLNLKHDYPSSFYWSRVAKALLDLDLAGSQAIITKVMGTEWLQNYVDTKNLKPIPNYLLPQVLTDK